MEVAILTMKPNASFGDTHTHLGEEVIHVIEGEAGIQLGEREIVLKPGETVTLDPRLQHNIRNIGEGEVKALVAIAPPNPRLPQK
jgi:mannose-6-phosphate isomerase-like protein (cupin superfamily)